MKLEQTFLHFLLQHQLKNKRTLNFLVLMDSILTAARLIQLNYQNGRMDDLLGVSGQTNKSGDKVMKLDEIAHSVVMHYLIESQQVIMAVSEESEKTIDLNPAGRYFVYFDPLDGSSNVQHSLPVGFLFAIAKKNLTGIEDNSLRCGKEFVAAGIFTIPNGIFTFALRDAGAWRFILDNSGNYVRPSMVILPKNPKNWELSYNAGNQPYFSEKVSNWIDAKKTSCSFRYSGSLAIDFHRLLNTGGMFLYPSIIRHSDPAKNRPEGKLRLLYESAVISFIANEAGGAAIDESKRDILSINPTTPHQKSSLFVGTKELIQDLKNSL